MLRAAILASLISLAPIAASAGPNAQLLASISARLSQWNVGEVDYNALTTAQAGALHLKLTNAPPRFSNRAHFFRQELLIILNDKAPDKK